MHVLASIGLQGVPRREPSLVLSAVAALTAQDAALVVGARVPPVLRVGRVTVRAGKMRGAGVGWTVGWTGIARERQRRRGRCGGEPPRRRRHRLRHHGVPNARVGRTPDPPPHHVTVSLE